MYPKVIAYCEDVNLDEHGWITEDRQNDFWEMHNNDKKLQNDDKGMHRDNTDANGP